MFKTKLWYVDLLDPRHALTDESILIFDKGDQYKGAKEVAMEIYQLSSQCARRNYNLGMKAGIAIGIIGTGIGIGLVIRDRRKQDKLKNTEKEEA